MKAVSLMTWVDLTDGHEYRAGEYFPHDGRTIPDKRLKELATDKNQIGAPLILIVEESEKQ